jgi:hypothetical protein
MPIMLSYSRKDEAVVKGLARDFEAAKREVWFDHNLVGGDAWWDSILENIRLATVFIFALSDASLHSKPCRLELDYALALARPIVPVRVGPVRSFRASPLAALQIIDYSPDAPRSGFAVLAAVDDAAKRVRPLPDPLPPAPPIPFAYLLAIGRQIESAELPLADQMAAVDQLRRALREETDESVRQDILAMLTNLNGKPWTAKQTEREIAAVLYAHAPELLRHDDEEDRTVIRRAWRPVSAEPAEPEAPAEPSPPPAAGPDPRERSAERAEPAEPGAPAEPSRPPAAGPDPRGWFAERAEPAEPAESAEPGAPAEPSRPPAAEPDPREWFAERLEQLQRQRAAQEAAADPDPPPWRPSADAAGAWSRTFGREARPWPAANPVAPASPPGPTSTPPPGAPPTPPYYAEPGRHTTGPIPTVQQSGAHYPGPQGPTEQHPTGQFPTEQFPAGQPPRAQPSGQQPSGGPAAPTDSAPPVGALTVPPPDYGRMSTLSCLLPPWLFGLVAWRYSRQVRERHQAGDAAGARKASRKAKAWAIVGIVVGLALLVLLITLPASKS